MLGMVLELGERLVDAANDLAQGGDALDMPAELLVHFQIVRKEGEPLIPLSVVDIIIVALNYFFGFHAQFLMFGVRAVLLYKVAQTPSIVGRAARRPRAGAGSLVAADAKLAHQAKHIDIVPGLDNLAVGHAQDAD